MKIDQKEIIKALLVVVVSIAAVAGCWQIGHGLRNFRQGENKIKVTGMAEKQITSDLNCVEHHRFGQSRFEKQCLRRV